MMGVRSTIAYFPPVAIGKWIRETLGVFAVLESDCFGLPPFIG